MKLPVIEPYTFPVILPSSGESVIARPFLVREEKLMLMAQESKDPTEQLEAVAQIIRNCTNGRVEPNTAPYFDIEYLLLQLRARSVGEVINLTYKCNATREVDGNSEPCGQKTPININLLEISVPLTDEIQATRTFDINDTYRLSLQYPTIYSIAKFLEAQQTSTADTFDAPLNQLTDLFDTLHNKLTNETFMFQEYPLDDKIEFFNNLPPSSFEKILSFWQKLPVIKHTESYVCERCGYSHTLNFTGITDFLE